MGRRDQKDDAEKAGGYKNKIKSHHLEIDDYLISDRTGIFRAARLATDLTSIGAVQDLIRSYL
jgi:hypothetical protein